MIKLSYGDKLRMQTLREQGLGAKAITSKFQLPWQRVEVEHCWESLQLSRPHYLSRSA